MPVDGDIYGMECGRDACLASGPKNAINFSNFSLSGGDNVNAGPFSFTYKNECYMTETEGFCAAGEVVRFYAEKKSPSCDPRDWVLCARVGGWSSDVKTPCKPGFMEDSVRNLCVPQSGADFD